LDASLIERLRSKDAGVLASAIKDALADLDEGYLPYIVAALYHQNPEVRQVAAMALRRFRDPRSADLAMFALATEENPDILFELAMVFLYHPRKEAVEVLLPYLLHEDYRLRSAAVEVLGAISSIYRIPELIAPLLRMLEDKRSSVVMVTLRSLSHAVESLDSSEEMEKVMDEIEPLTRCEDKMVRELADRVLERMREMHHLMPMSDSEEGRPS
jgi:HEAT repeat protein